MSWKLGSNRFRTYASAHPSGGIHPSAAVSFRVRARAALQLLPATSGRFGVQSQSYHVHEEGHDVMGRVSPVYPDAAAEHFGEWQRNETNGFSPERLWHW